MDNKNKKTILIDLDGVLNNYNGNFDKNFIPNIREGAYHFLKNLSDDFEIKIFTTRNKMLVVKWLITNKIDCFISEVTNIKEVAYLYIDDRAICFDDNYNSLFNQIRKFKPHWK